MVVDCRSWVSASRRRSELAGPRHPGNGRARLSGVRAQGRKPLPSVGANVHSTRPNTTTVRGIEPAARSSLPPVPWRDPHTVSPADLAPISSNSRPRASTNPQSADLRTCLGMAYAVNYDVYKSMDALEDGRAVEPDNFWAQLKYAELHYRLRALTTRRRGDAPRRPTWRQIRGSWRWRASRCRKSGALSTERPQRRLDQAAHGPPTLRPFGDAAGRSSS